jgi:2-oxoglutarate ferredoxin oxidoreductase subunit gamma
MEAAAQMSNSKVFNMLVLGGLLKARPQLATVEDVVSGLRKTLPERHHGLIPMNEEAIRKGMELIREV